MCSVELERRKKDEMPLSAIGHLCLLAQRLT